MQRGVEKRKQQMVVCHESNSLIHHFLGLLVNIHMGRRDTGNENEEKKENLLEVDDRINIRYSASGKLGDIIEQHAPYIAKETLALTVKQQDNLAAGIAYDIEEMQLELELEKA